METGRSGGRGADAFLSGLVGGVVRKRRVPVLRRTPVPEVIASS
ncbi:hypothetical protein HMPREF9440_01027 [Sutterella parvirubra YIT 11816]|uniref:Uncharacterized protein n=1 Tax=Sutterella parvirubra YIT 11816 TaxID=762967 RepID=H3KE63_9BURK|nr:hypothetical protein HMPREF9440_01027 [Sutterella parvirubra YIT 11816]